MEDRITTPTGDRQHELLGIWQDEIHRPGHYGIRDPSSMSSWFDIVPRGIGRTANDREVVQPLRTREVVQPLMTRLEWAWCQENFAVDVRVVVRRKKCDHAYAVAQLVDDDLNAAMERNQPAKDPRFWMAVVRTIRSSLDIIEQAYLAHFDLEQCVTELENAVED